MLQKSFTMAKTNVIRCLKNNNFINESRNSIEVKNFLFTNEISKEELINIIKSSDGNCHSIIPHSKHKNINIHVIQHQKFYIKFYFITKDEAIFISIHK